MDISIQYLAGIFDGEGCILIAKYKKAIKENIRGVAFAPYMTIANIYIPLLEKIQAQFGGRIRRESGDRTYALYFSPNEIRELLPQVFPYLIIKETQAKIMLDFLDKKEENQCLRISDELFSFYESCYHKLRDMKRIKFNYEKSNPHIIAERNCIICGEKFQVLSTTHWKKYCSKKCSANQRSQKIQVSCDYCGTTLIRSPSHIRGKHNYCSRECRHLYNTSEVECSYCGKKYIRPKSLLVSFRLTENIEKYINVLQFITLKT